MFLSGLFVQKLKETMTSNLNHIFRMPFAAGLVFSASMLDTLLYQVGPFYLSGTAFCHHYERPPQWKTTLLKCHPDENYLVEMPPWWKTPWWKTTLLKCLLSERPPCWNATSVKDHPVEMPPQWKTTLLKCHLSERPPCWNATLLEMPPYWNAIRFKDHPDKSPPCWKATPTKDPVKCHPRWNVSLMMCCVRRSSRVNSSCFCELFSLRHNPFYLTVALLQTFVEGYLFILMCNVVLSTTLPSLLDCHTVSDICQGLPHHICSSPPGHRRWGRIRSSLQRKSCTSCA